MLVSHQNKLSIVIFHSVLVYGTWYSKGLGSRLFESKANFALAGFIPANLRSSSGHQENLSNSRGPTLAFKENK